MDALAVVKDEDRKVTYLEDHRDLLIYGRPGEKGAEAYQVAATRWVDWMTDADKQPVDSDIREYFMMLKWGHTPTGKPWSVATIQHHRQAVKHRVMLMALENGDAAFTAVIRGMFANIDHDIPAPKRDKELGNRDKFLTRDEVAKLKDAAGSERQRLLIETLWITGARVAELCSMRLDSSEEGEDGVNFTVIGKGGKHRSLFVPYGLYQRIRAAFPGSEWLFTTINGDAFRGDYVSRLVKRVGKRIGKNISAHVMRHSIITYHIKNGKDIESARDFAGHSSVSTTQLYIHSKISSKERALAAV